MRSDSEMVNLRSVIEMLCYMVDEDSDGVEEIMQLPSIDLVCCKECKKAHLTYDGQCKYCDEWKDNDDNYIEVYHDGNHYCSYGVRRESE